MRYRFLGAAILILLLATALRFHRIETQSFWNDEGNSARLSERSIKLIIEGTASDIHPPLYYLILRGWRELLGDSEFALRAFSAFVGIGLVAATLALGQRLIGSDAYAASLLAGFLVAINPALVYYSQETRMYELLAFLAIFSTLLLVMWLQGGRRKFAMAAAYILTVVAGLYTHYFFPAVLVTQNLIFLLWIVIQWRSSPQPKRDGLLPVAILPSIRRWIAMMLVVLLLYLPWVPTYWQQAGDRPQLRTAISDFLINGFRWSAFGSTLGEAIGQWLLIALLLLAVFGAWFGRRRLSKGVPYTAALLLSIFVPLFLMWLMGATQPAFFKFIVVIIPPVCLLAGPGWWWGWRWTLGYSDVEMDSAAGKELSSDLSGISGSGLRYVTRLLLVVLAAAVLVGSARSLINMYYEPAYARADYRGMAEQIAGEAQPNAGIVLNAANQWEVFTYYHQEGAPVYPLPRGYPDQALIDQELSQIADQHSRIYALFWGEAERDPQRFVERWLDANAFKARDEWRGDVRFVTYAVPSSTSELFEIDDDAVAGARFGDVIQLESVKLLSDDLLPGDIIQVELAWKTDEVIDQRYKVFLHLVDKNGEILAQRDSEPGGGLALTTTWTPGETITDNHGVLVPFEVQPGQYSLVLGLYNALDPTDRLPIYSAGGETDSLLLTTITIRKTEG